MKRVTGRVNYSSSHGVRPYKPSRFLYMTEQIRPPAECQYWAVQMWLVCGNAYIWNRIRSSYTTDTRGRVNLAGQMEQWIQDVIDWIWKIEIMIWCNTIIHRFPTRRRINRCQASGSMKYIFVFYNFWTLRWNTGYVRSAGLCLPRGMIVNTCRYLRSFFVEDTDLPT